MSPLNKILHVLFVVAWVVRGDILHLSNERIAPGQAKMLHQFTFDKSLPNKIKISIDLTLLYTKRPAYIHLVFSDTIEGLVPEGNDDSYKANCSASFPFFDLKNGSNIILNYTLEFPDKSSSYLIFSKEVEINYTGPLYTFIVFCGEPSSSSLKPAVILHGSISYSNSYGFLSAAQSKLIPAYSILFGISLLFSCLYGIFLCKNKKYSKAIHCYYYVSICIFTLETFVILANSISSNLNGNKNSTLTLLYILLCSLTASISFLLLFFVSAGATYKEVSINTLPDKVKITLFCFFLTYISYLAAEHFYDSQAVGAMLGIILVETGLMLCWMISRFTNTLIELTENKQEQPIRVIKTLRGIMIIVSAIAAAGAILEAILLFKTTKEEYKDLKWKSEFCWQILYLVTFVCVGIMMRPYKREDIEGEYNENVADSSQASGISRIEHLDKEIVVDISNLYKDENDVVN